MNIVELAREYECQYNTLCAKLDGLKPLLCVYSGQELMMLRRKMKIYYDMACECKNTYILLSAYYDDNEEEI